MSVEQQQQQQQFTGINTTDPYPSPYYSQQQQQQPSSSSSSSTNEHYFDMNQQQQQQQQNEESSSLLHHSPTTNNNKKKKKKKAFCCGAAHCAHSCSCNIGDYIKSVLFGGLDGICTVFVCIATIVNISTGHVPMIYILILGVAKLMSGAISMGIGDFMSSKAEVDLIRLERKREMWECENFIRGEMDEMADIYVEKGLKKESAMKMVELMSRNKKAFVDVMMVQELGLSADYDAWFPLKSGLINFSSFIFFGSIPMLIYVVTTVVDSVGKNRSNLDQHGIFYIDIGITCFTLILMGALKSKFSSQHFLISILFTVIVGIIAAGSGYLVAYLLATGLHIKNVD